MIHSRYFAARTGVFAQKAKDFSKIQGPMAADLGTLPDVLAEPRARVGLDLVVKLAYAAMGRHAVDHHQAHAHHNCPAQHLC